MARLRVMSWNLRTFGSNTSQEDINLIAKIIEQNSPDIICIQEIQIGRGIPNVIGHPISPEKFQKVAELHETLEERVWDGNVTGVNRGVNESGSMRDAYAFFWRENHFKKIDGKVSIINESHWSGRRAGLGEFSLEDGKGNKYELNIISIHAATNQTAHPNAIDSIRSVSDLDIVKSPQKPTLVLGDFNYNVDGDKKPYETLLGRGYTMCIKNLDGSPILTTYSPQVPSQHQAPKRVSSYDNIFSHGLTLSGGGGAYDFINKEMNSLVTEKGMSREDGFNRLYKGQHMPNGISDHLPVWHDFTI